LYFTKLKKAIQGERGWNCVERKNPTLSVAHMTICAIEVCATEL
jgi:hypothetical protein